MNNFKCIYPNPFRQREVEHDFNLDEILEDVSETLEPYFDFEENFYLISQDFDEFGYERIDKRVIKILQDSILQTSDYLKEKFQKKIPFLYNLIKKKLLYVNNLKNYNENLRYLDFPVQSNVDKYGFETEILSNEIFENAMEEIEEGLSYIYSYAGNTLPDTMESWEEHILYSYDGLINYPHVCHDELLEILYESLDIIFDDARKNYSMFLNSFVTGDMNSRIIKIIRPRLSQGVIDYSIICAISLSCFVSLCLLTHQITRKYGGTVNWVEFFTNEPKAFCNEFITVLGLYEESFVFSRFEVQQNIKDIKIKLLSLKTKTKYLLLKLVLGN